MLARNEPSSIKNRQIHSIFVSIFQAEISLAGVKTFSYTNTHTHKQTLTIISLFHECVSAVVPRVKKFSFKENQNCEKISNNKKTKFTAFGIF
jgi:hypothetical protein